ncbi:uncharacterized protein LOC115321749 isoform X1 [Ixodes scapularis]|uniref:uncharacterized protein LOC115321749 isoform X1 n=1 Tax=Ixodes scapularis TaxID=6945 RepID=UPI001A9E792C|nr:uncharacterized protein LOC115321749 isoform X1 [Ixodes scapularis]
MTSSVSSLSTLLSAQCPENRTIADFWTLKLSSTIDSRCTQKFPCVCNVSMSPTMRTRSSAYARPGGAQCVTHPFSIRPSVKPSPDVSSRLSSSAVYKLYRNGLPAALVLVDGLVLSIRLVLRQVLCQVVYHMSHPAATGAAVSPSSRLRLLALPNSTTAEQTRRQPSTS